MNELEKQRILGLVSEGLIRPEEARGLLAALSELPKSTAAEKQRILSMVADGILSPAEARKLLAALPDDSVGASEPIANPKPAVKAPGAVKPEAKEQLMEVQMQRADGSSYTIQVPPNLVPLFWNIAKVAIKESARTAAQETWSGFKHIVKRTTREMGENVKSKVTSIGSKPVPALESAGSSEADTFEARRRILQMVQNGRINAEDASRLIQQLDAVEAHNRKMRAD